VLVWYHVDGCPFTSVTNVRTEVDKDGFEELLEEPASFDELDPRDDDWPLD